MTIVVVGVNHITEVIVIYAILLRRSERGIVTPHKKHAAFLALLFEKVMIHPIVATLRAEEINPMLTPAWLLFFIEPKLTASDPHMAAIRQADGVLIRIVFKNETFQDKVFAVFQIKPRMTCACEAFKVVS